MYLTQLEVCFIMVIMSVDTVSNAALVDENFVTRNRNFISKSIVKKNKTNDAIDMPFVVDFDIEEDSRDEEQLLQRILSRVNVLNPHGRQQKLRNLPMAKFLSRNKRSIFGIDDRNLVETSVKTQEYPFSTVVYLTSGCTGTLVGVQHVLTAAHCVHNGRKFLKQAKNLRIGMTLHSFIILVYNQVIDGGRLIDRPVVKKRIFKRTFLRILHLNLKHYFFLLGFLNCFHTVVVKGRHLQGNYLTISQQLLKSLSRGRVLRIANCDAAAE